jgi:hypothetical protein
MGHWDGIRKTVSFFLDTGVSRSVLTEYVSHLKKASFPIVGVDGIPNRPNIIPPLYCTFGSKSFTHSFLAIPACPFPILE